MGGRIPSRTLRRSLYKPMEGIVLLLGSPENRPGPSPIPDLKHEDTAGSSALLAEAG